MRRISPLRRARWSAARANAPPKPAPHAQYGAGSGERGNGPTRLAQRRQRPAEIGHQPAHFGPARAGQHDDERRGGGGAARLGRVWPQFAEAFDQRMADIDAARSTQPPVRLRFERQQRQHAIDIRSHRPGPARPPGPDAGTDVIEDWQFRQCPPHTAGDAVGEVGTVDDDEGVEQRGDDRCGGLVDARDKRRQPGQDRQNAHDSDVADRKQALEALGLHGFAADAGEGDLAQAGFAERPHELKAKLVARVLAGDESHAQRAHPPGLAYEIQRRTGWRRPLPGRSAPARG